MNILLDPQIFNQQTYGGISRYYTEVFSILSKKDNVKVFLPIYFSDNAYLRNTDLLVKDKKLDVLVSILNFFKISNKSFRRKKTEKLLQKYFSEDDYDVFIPTYYNPYFLDRINDKPFVLTVYDMIHEIMPQYFENDLYQVAENKKKLIEKATNIIAVSHNTKKDILRFFPNINPDKIKVIYHGSSIKIDPGTKVDLPKDYVLYVGARAHYKNFEFLLKAIAPILKNNPELKLVAAGGGEFDVEEVQYIKNIDLETQVVQRNFKENELGHFYKNAKVFIFPSLYEGFGIPVLESMACGCPIILSKCGSLPEVAGNAGLFFDNEEDLCEKIKLLLSDEKLRKTYSEKGLAHVKKFDWKVAAEQCLKVYSETINEQK